MWYLIVFFGLFELILVLDVLWWLIVDLELFYVVGVFFLIL